MTAIEKIEEALLSQAGKLYVVVPVDAIEEILEEWYHVCDDRDSLPTMKTREAFIAAQETPDQVTRAKKLLGWKG